MFMVLMRGTVVTLAKTGKTVHFRTVEPPPEVCYHVRVSASAEHFRQATLRAAAAMTPEQRVLRALALGQSDLELFAAVSGRTLDEARAELRRRRELERQPAARQQDR
jgi:hypothetical protein